MTDTTALARRPTGPLTAAPALTAGGELDRDSLGVMLDMAGRLYKSGFCPTQLKNEGQVLAVILTGRELGLGPMASLRNISIINQRASLSAELLAALIYQAHGEDALIPVEAECTAQRATFRYKRRGWQQHHTHVFTLEEARAANLLGKDVWKSYPAAMLRARCISAIAKIAFQEIGLGLYTTEEAESIPADPPRAMSTAPNGEPVDVTTGEFVEVPADPPALRIVPATPDADFAALGANPAAARDALYERLAAVLAPLGMSNKELSAQIKDRHQGQGAKDLALAALEAECEFWESQAADIQGV